MADNMSGNAAGDQLGAMPDDSANTCQVSADMLPDAKKGDVYTVMATDGKMVTLSKQASEEDESATWKQGAHDAVAGAEDM